MTDPNQLDIEAIIARLPHRFPFLLVDRVLSFKANESIVAIKNVSINEAHFVGHFPQYPVMPGVLIIEALAQAAGVLSWESAREDDDNVTILYLAGLENVRFKQPVTPGDQLILKAELLKRRRALWRYRCVAEVDDDVVAEAEIIMVTRKEP
ncbi:MAG: 3-hydroxyacyl-ACP dehydratase FabZ [Gammaproteobacteria bacterium]|nr:3-hydroxyacyl-ACP dehydratase FabZ [Gammaproteobacteria bacterium]